MSPSASSTRSSPAFADFVADAEAPIDDPHLYGADIERRGTSVYRRFDDLRELTPSG